ncbi:MAG: (2Fe-2S) ferredoxin domain-containing protein [Leptolyngbyaceae cyanobacterium]
MNLSHDIERVAQANVQRSQGIVLKGQFSDVLRSPKGKIKGIYLHTGEQVLAIKLPKYLRPVLVRELAPKAFVQVWAYREENQWRGINILPLSDPETLALQASWPGIGASEPAVPAATSSQSPSPQLRVQVCRKGKCFKQGGCQILRSLETAIATDPNLQHVAVEGVGCMKACKKGPNLKLSNSPKVFSGLTPEKAIAVVSQQV